MSENKKEIQTELKLYFGYFISGELRSVDDTDPFSSWSLESKR